MSEQTIKKILIKETAEDIIKTFGLDIDVYDICEIINLNLGWSINLPEDTTEEYTDE